MNEVGGGGGGGGEIGFSVTLHRFPNKTLIEYNEQTIYVNILFCHRLYLSLFVKVSNNLAKAIFISSM